MDASQLDRKLRRVIEAAEALGRSSDRDTLHRTVVEQAVQTFGFERCRLYLPRGGEFFCACAAEREGGVTENPDDVLADPLLPPPTWLESLPAGGPRWTMLDDVPYPGAKAVSGLSPRGWVVITAAWAEGRIAPRGLLLNDTALTGHPVDEPQQEELALFGAMVGHALLRCDEICTEREFAAQRYQAERMEALARMAGVVAHDLNNLLMPVIGYSKLVADRLDKEDAIRSDALEILRAGEEISELAALLLAAGQRRMKPVGVSHLHQVIADELDAFQELVGNRIRIETHLSDTLPPVQAAPETLTETIHCLLRNARDASPNGGRIRISAESCALDAAFCRRHLQVRPGDYVRLTVEDDGYGMTEEISAQAFDPFFTTKSPRRGIGLGLSVVYGMVRQCGGCIRLHSRPDEGTRVELFFPPTVPGKRPAPPVTAPVRAGAKETILVVEDEQRVRKIIVRMLKKLGYDVLEAADGKKALAMVARHPGDLHLVLTDVVMPGLGGRETVERLRALRSDFRVLYMSGYADADLGDPDADILRKPFTDKILGARIRAALDR